MVSVASKTTQEFIPIKEIRDGVVVLKDGGMRAIILASSLNFALKSADEQNAIISQFQNFLNSLDFSVQIFVQSKRLDIRPYIALLEQRYRDQQSDLMKIQTREYIGFIKNFIENSNIMTKSFFIVIPFSPSLVNNKKSPIENIFGKGKQTKSEISLDKTKQFEEYRTQLDQRIAVVEQGLVRCGIRLIQLGTEEIVELYYRLFNPGDVEKPIPIE